MFYPDGYDSDIILDLYQRGVQFRISPGAPVALTDICGSPQTLQASVSLLRLLGWFPLNPPFIPSCHSAPWRVDPNNIVKQTTEINFLAKRLINLFL
jgi:hypothetical protein